MGSGVAHIVSRGLLQAGLALVGDGPRGMASVQLQWPEHPSAIIAPAPCRSACRLLLGSAAQSADWDENRCRRDRDTRQRS